MRSAPQEGRRLSDFSSLPFPSLGWSASGQYISEDTELLTELFSKFSHPNLILDQLEVLMNFMKFILVINSNSARWRCTKIFDWFKIQIVAGKNEELRI